MSETGQPDAAAMAARREAIAAASIGAQVILDFNEAGSLGARGGAGGDIVENTMARDAFLVSRGLDPLAPSGPPPTPEALEARRAKAERELEPDPAEAVSRKATRMSSLAAGISHEIDDPEPLPEQKVPPPPPAPEPEPAREA